MTVLQWFAGGRQGQFGCLVQLEANLSTMTDSTLSMILKFMLILQYNFRLSLRWNAQIITASTDAIVI